MAGKYWFNSKVARSEVETGSDVGTGNEGDVGAEGEKCQRPDAFVLEDGTAYAITTLEDGQIQYLVSDPSRNYLDTE